MINLSGNWTLKDSNNEYCVDMNIPGDGICALLNAKVIDDPYYAKNEYDTRWIAQRVWKITREFEIDDIDQYELVISQIDCLSNIYINSTLVLKTDNAFRTFKGDVKSALIKGKNIIEIEFLSNTQEAEKIQKSQPYYIPYLEFNCDIPDGNMLRKTQCDFGWDWNIALAPFGLYGEIKLVKKQANLNSIIVHQTHNKHSVELNIQFEIEHFELNKTYELEFDIDGQNFSYIASSPIENVSIEIQNPKLWWPVGWGEQFLYDLSIKLESQIIHKKIGLRTIELLTNKDNESDPDSGSQFTFLVNAKRCYSRGVNWIPQDALASNITPEKTRNLLQSAVDANMNMIRVWGGGRYEQDWFYDLCSELGLLVWQDFMFACNIYPSDNEFLDNVALEVQEQVKRLNTHACLALWCGDNELIGALNWFEITKQHRDRYLVGYDRLNRTIETNLKQTDEKSIWWPSSPTSGPMDFSDAWHDDKSGDMHFWDVWHSGKDFEHYRTINPRFCSEFGFQSFPSMHIIKTFCEEKDWNIASQVMESHQKNDGGNARIAQTMFRYFRFPNGFENFVYLSQVQQGLAIKTAVEYWRSIKPHCMGTLYWQLNDTWPTASWSSLNHGGSWKAMHYMLKRFYQPVAVFAIEEDGIIKFTAVNDTLENINLTLTISISDLKGNVSELSKIKQSVSTDNHHKIFELNTNELAENEVLIYEFESSNNMQGIEHFSPEPYKALDLQDSQITFDANIINDQIEINITCQALSFFATLECDEPVKFSDNVLMLMPNKTYKIIATIEKDKLQSALSSLKINDLYRCSY